MLQLIAHANIAYAHGATECSAHKQHTGDGIMRGLTPSALRLAARLIVTVAWSRA